MRGNVLDGKGRLLAQPGGDLQFGGVILSAGLQLLLAPAVALQFRRDNPFGLGLGSLTVQSPGGMAPQAAFHLLLAACGLLQVVAGINRPVFCEPRLGHQPS